MRRDVEARLEGLLDAKLDAAAEHGPEAERLVTAVADLSLRGGKRLRAGLLVAGYRAASASADLEPALDAGVALELLQSYFLIHDDWMDDDSIRRGGPSVHASLGKQYRSRDRGAWSAILAGDLAVAMATEALARTDIPASRMPRVFACFAQMQGDAVIGQQLDVTGRARSVEDVYALKTGSYTVRGPLRLGALLAGGPPKVLRALDRFALPVGIAFQLRDDILSLFGDPKKTGKPFANDLRTGKRTALLAYALDHARGKELKALRAVVGNPKASRAALARGVEAIERSGARAEIERRIQGLVSTGLRPLKPGTVTTTGRGLLEGAARALTARRS